MKKHLSRRKPKTLLEAGVGMWHSAGRKFWRSIMSEEVTKRELMVVIETMNDKFQQVLECFAIHSKEIADLKTELKEDIAIVDLKVMGLAKRVDHVEDRLSREIAEVKSDLAEVKSDLAEVKSDLAEVKSDLIAHRENVELHVVSKKRTLKKVV
jgi:chromosome segregation ATPase